MSPQDRIEQAVIATLRRAQRKPAPPKLAAALEYAVLPGGARVRPMLALSVALACGDDRPKLSAAGAASLELMHCASLVHDDLPCFDDADIRRGKPAVHRAFGEEIAVLVGDTLIVSAFESLALHASEDCMRTSSLIQVLAGATGFARGYLRRSGLGKRSPRQSRRLSQGQNRGFVHGGDAYGCPRGGS